MEGKTFWFQCWLRKDTPPCFFPGHNREQAEKRLQTFLEHYALNDENTMIEVYHCTETISARCRLEEKGPPLFFPARTFQAAKRKARRFLNENGLFNDMVIFEKRRPRKRLITPRRLKRRRIRALLQNQ